MYVKGPLVGNPVTCIQYKASLFISCHLVSPGHFAVLSWLQNQGYSYQKQLITHALRGQFVKLNMRSNWTCNKDVALGTQAFALPSLWQLVVYFGFAAGTQCMVTCIVLATAHTHTHTHHTDMHTQYHTHRQKGCRVIFYYCTTSFFSVEKWPTFQNNRFHSCFLTICSENNKITTRERCHSHVFNSLTKLLPKNACLGNLLPWRLN